MSPKPGLDRRALLASALGAAFAGAVSPLPASAQPSPQPGALSAARYSRRARRIVENALVIDMLAPLKLDFRPEAFAEPLAAADAAAFRASGITGFNHAVGVGGATAREQALEFMAAWSGFVGRHPELFRLVSGTADLDAAKAEKRIGVILGLQNADQFRDAADVKTFHLLGLRCAQLTYNSQNLLGSGSTDRVDGGLSDFGAEIVAAMNAAGMLVDTSHCGERTTLDAIAVSTKPIAITHSNCRALNPHVRNKSDEAIKALAAKGGVMGITGVRMFISTSDPTTVRQMADHVDHVARLVGIEHVGIGSDADLAGYDDMPADQYEQLKAGYKSSYGFREKIDTDGFDHPMKIYDLTEELIRRNYSDANIALVLGGNFRRLLEATIG